MMPGLASDCTNQLNTHNMSLLGLIIAIVVVGVILYLINAYIPMDDKIKKVLNIVVVIVLVVWLLKILGAWAYLGRVDI